MRITGQLSGIAITLVIMFLSCGNNNASSNEANAAVEPISENNTELVNLTEDVNGKPFKLKGSLQGANNQLVFLSKLTTTKLEFIDSVRTDGNGAFEISKDLSKSDLFFITFNKMQPPGVPVVLGPGSKLSIDMVQGDFIETKVKGDAVNSDMKALYDTYIAHNKASAEFNQRVSQIDPRTASPAQRESIQKEYNELQSNMVKDIEAFVNSHKGSLVSFFAATYIIPQTPISLQDAALKKMKQDAPALAETKELQDRLDAIKPLDIGGLAPDIVMNSPEGQEVKLSSLRGKVVLIDFWASWCGPCRRENPNVVKAYNKYKDKGFEIYGVSLDNDKSKWEYAIKKDGITWVQVSDLRGWQNAAAKRYKVSSIPQTVLLDKDGRIIAKNLRGAALEAKLAEVLGDS